MHVHYGPAAMSQKQNSWLCYNSYAYYMAEEKRFGIYLLLEIFWQEKVVAMAKLMNS